MPSVRTLRALKDESVSLAPMLYSVSAWITASSRAFWVASDSLSSACRARTIATSSASVSVIGSNASGLPNPKDR